jgi:phospholipase/carboxylesterase
MLEFKVSQPLTGEPPHPAIMLLHGRGTNEMDLLSLGLELDPRLLTISPRAPLAFGPGSYYWYDLERAMIGRPDPNGLHRSLAMLTELLDHVCSTYAIDTKRMFVGGFSMGGAMTAAMLLTHPERLTGAMILSSYVPLHSGMEWETAGATGKPVFQAHGLYDDVLPLEFGRMSRDFLAPVVNLTYHEYAMAHQVSADELADASSWMRELL